MDETTSSVGPAQVLGSQSKRLLWALAATAGLAAAGLTIWWWQLRHAVRYITAPVTRGDIVRSINMTGALNPVVTAQVGSYVSGNIKSWSCDYNTMVKIGQRCAQIDPLPFQVVVDEDTADLRSSKAQLVKDQAAAKNARIVYERDSKLRVQGIVSQETLDGDKATLDQDVAQIAYDRAQIGLKQAALHAAQVNLAYTNIVSPVNGMVITRYIDVGQTVVSNLQSSTLFLIGKDMTKMQVDTNVSEADVGDVHEGERSYFTVQAYPNRTFEGRVRQIRHGPITVQNVVTYDVVVDVDNRDLALFPGMTADAHIVTAEHKDVLRVPLQATRFIPEGLARVGRSTASEWASSRMAGSRPRGTGAQSGSGHRGPGDQRWEGGAGHRMQRFHYGFARVWVMRDGELTPVRVRTGLDDGTLIEVISSQLKPGDQVVINAIRPGAPRPTGGTQRPPGTGSGRHGGGFRL